MRHDLDYTDLVCNSDLEGFNLKASSHSKMPAAKSVQIIFCARDPDWRLFNNFAFYIEISFRDAKEGSLGSLG